MTTVTHTHDHGPHDGGHHGPHDGGHHGPHDGGSLIPGLGEHDHHGVGPSPEDEHLPPPSTEASVVMDIGGSVGGAVVFAPASMLGSEIEIRPVGAPWRGAHTAVRERQLPDAVRYAGLFGSLGAGPYELRVKGGPDDRPALRLVVEGGRVVQADWPR